MALNPRLRARLEREREQQKRMSSQQLDELARLLPEGQVLLNEPTKNHSGARVGGPVEAFIITNDIDELKRVLGWADEHSIDYRFFGTGSFQLVRDGGLNGIMIKLGKNFANIVVDRSSESEVFVSAGGGARVWELAAFLKAQGISGANKLCGAQGTLGGLLCAQAIPDGKALDDIVEEITIITRERRELTLRGSGLRFEEGRLKIPRTACVIKILFKLARASAEQIDADKSCDVPCFAFAFKSPCRTAAQILIEEAGLSGVRVGSARVSADNPCTILNEGTASAKDITVLVSLIKDRVKQASGILLVPTIDIMGER